MSTRSGSADPGDVADEPSVPRSRQSIDGTPLRRVRPRLAGELRQLLEPLPALARHPPQALGQGDQRGHPLREEEQDRRRRQQEQP